MFRDHKDGLPSIRRRTIIQYFNILELKWRPKTPPSRRITNCFTQWQGAGWRGVVGVEPLAIFSTPCLLHLQPPADRLNLRPDPVCGYSHCYKFFAMKMRKSLHFYLKSKNKISLGGGDPTPSWPWPLDPLLFSVNSHSAVWILHRPTIWPWVKSRRTYK